MTVKRGEELEVDVGVRFDVSLIGGPFKVSSSYSSDSGFPTARRRHYSRWRNRQLAKCMFFPSILILMPVEVSHVVFYLRIQGPIACGSRIVRIQYPPSVQGWLVWTVPIHIIHIFTFSTPYMSYIGPWTIYPFRIASDYSGKAESLFFEISTELLSSLSSALCSVDCLKEYIQSS